MYEYFSRNNTNKIRHLENYNAFVSIDYGNYNNRDMNYSFENGVFTIKTSQDDRIFSFSMKEMIIELLENGNEEKDYSIIGDNYSILINSFQGWYNEEKADPITLNRFRGYLFYNR